MCIVEYLLVSNGNTFFKAGKANVESLDIVSIEIICININSSGCIVNIYHILLLESGNLDVVFREAEFDIFRFLVVRLIVRIATENCRSGCKGREEINFFHIAVKVSKLFLKLTSATHFILKNISICRNHLEVDAAVVQIVPTLKPKTQSQAILVGHFEARRGWNSGFQTAFLES